MSEKKREESATESENSEKFPLDEEEQPSLEMEPKPGTTEQQDSLDDMGAQPGTPITVGGDG